MERPTRIELGKASDDFKNAGNGGLFNVFEVPQMENRWKMGDGKWSYRQVRRALLSTKIGLLSIRHFPPNRHVRQERFGRKKPCARGWPSFLENLSLRRVPGRGMG